MKRIHLCVLLAMGMTQAATLPYQGLSTDAKGKPLADAAYPVVFALYGAASGGTSLWTETQTVSTTKGLFSTSLGAVAAVPDSLFNGSSLYLGVSFDGGAEGGRSLLGTTPWAKRSGSSATSSYSDSSGKLAGFTDSLSAVRTTLQSHKTKAGQDSLLLADRIAADSANLVQLKGTVGSQAATIASQGLQIQRLLNSAPLNSGIPWNNAIRYGSLTDSRDGQVYRTVAIGPRGSEQNWMAQNLNHAGTGTVVGLCYGASPDSCAKYGRLYTWAEAMGADKRYDSTLMTPTLPAQGICPAGWHLPDTTEWRNLQTAVGTTSGTKLKSAAGWNSNGAVAGNGSDSVGFRGLPSGYFFNSAFDGANSNGRSWSATEISATSSSRALLSYNSDGLAYSGGSKRMEASVRCVQDPINAPNGTACAFEGQCASRICSEGFCGYKSGFGTCTTGTANTVCQSGSCTPALICR